MESSIHTNKIKLSLSGFEPAPQKRGGASTLPLIVDSVVKT